MRRFDPSSLRVQAILWTVVPLAVVITLVSAVGVFAFNQIVRSLVTTRDAELARISADRLSENMVNYGEILRSIAKTPELRSGSLPSQQGMLATAARNNLLAGFDGGVYLFDRDGMLIHSEPYRPELMGQTFAARDYFAAPSMRADAAQSFTFFSDVTLPFDDARDMVMVSVPIVSGTLFQGVIAGAFNIQTQQLGEEIRKLRVGANGFAYLVDRNGRVIFHRDAETVGADFSSHQAVQRLQRRDQNAIIINDGGITTVVGFAVVESTGWGLVITEPWEAVIGPIRVFQWVAGGALLVGLALAMVTVSLGTRRLTEPINALVGETARVAMGETGAPTVDGGTFREMRALANAFNDMAEKVARYRLGLQRYVAAVTHSQEEERKRIARELHDETIQSLIALGRRLEIMERSLENPIDAAKQLIQLQNMLNQTIAEVRQFSRDLRPLLLEDLGLVAALRQLLGEMERREGIVATLTLKGEPPPMLDSDLEVTTYRIAQEALSNIRKHAHASEVAIQLEFNPKGIYLTVQDNGRGFSIADTADLARRGSYGLMGIRERAQLVGGTLTIQSTPGEGTEVRVEIPFDGTPNWELLEPGPDEMVLTPQPTP